MLHQVASTSNGYCMNVRPSFLVEDGQHPATHFDLCSTHVKFFAPSRSHPSLQMSLTHLTPAYQGTKPTLFYPHPPVRAGLKGSEKAENSKKKKVPARSGKRGRPVGTTKSAGYRTSTGRPLGTTRAAGFKTSPGRPLGTTRAAGYKVSPGRPPGSIKALSHLGKLPYGASSGAGFPCRIMHKGGVCDRSGKDQEADGVTKMPLVSVPQFLACGFISTKSKHATTTTTQCCVL